MKNKLIAFASGAAILAIALYVGLLIGLTLPVAAVFSVLVTTPYSLLAALCGPKVLALPISGGAVGLFAVLFGQLLSTGGTIERDCYVFGSALGLCIFSLFGSVLVLALPQLRKRAIRAHTQHIG